MSWVGADVGKTKPGELAVVGRMGIIPLGVDVGGAVLVTELVEGVLVLVMVLVRIEDEEVPTVTV